MRTVEEVRRARLQQLRTDYGSLAALAAAMFDNRLDSTLNQILLQSVGSKTRKPKQMGSPLARKIEERLKKPRGWMDTDPDLESPAWPFGADVPPGAVAGLPPDLLSEARGMLKALLGQAARRPPASADSDPNSQQRAA